MLCGLPVVSSERIWKVQQFLCCESQQSSGGADGGNLASSHLTESRRLRGGVTSIYAVSNSLVDSIILNLLSGGTEGKRKEEGVKDYITLVFFSWQLWELFFFFLFSLNQVFNTRPGSELLNPLSLSSRVCVSHWVERQVTQQTRLSCACAKAKVTGLTP